MKIYDYIKEKRLLYLKTLLKTQRGVISEKDLTPIKDEIFNIEDNGRFQINGFENSFNEEIKDKIIIKNIICFNNKYNYNILTNSIRILSNDDNEDYIRLSKY